MVRNVNLATESKQKNKQTISLKSANIHVILGQGVSNSNMKRQTQAMYLIQRPPPLFGHGYSHHSLLPQGTSLFHIQVSFLPQSLPLEVECAQHRDISFQLLAC